MRRIIAATALLFLLSIRADATRSIMPAPQKKVACAMCLELDNETLPDKHYFPPIDLQAGAEALLSSPFAHAGTIAASLWVPATSHSGAEPDDAVPTEGPTQRTPVRRHGMPTKEPAGFENSGWAWGGLRECDRGPEGRVSAGCHTTQYDNLLCNSHYDECDNEFFTLAVTAVNEGNARQLRHMLEHSGGGTVLLNRARAAIQLVGCSGDVIGNLPLSAALLRALL